MPPLLSILFLLLLLLGGLPTAAALDLNYGPVAAGSNLSRVAQTLLTQQKLPRSDQNRLMAILLAANPEAFNQPCNINTLKRGVILTLTGAERLSQVDSRAAAAFIEQGYRRELNDSTEAACLALQPLYAQFKAPPAVVTPPVPPKPEPAAPPLPEPIAPPKPEPAAPPLLEPIAPPKPEPAAPPLPEPIAPPKPEPPAPPKPEPVVSPQPEPPVVDLKWMKIETMLADYWQTQPHPQNPHWLQLWPRVLAGAATVEYQVLNVVSKESNSYVLALAKLLEIFRQQQLKVALTVVNIDQSPERLKAALQFAEQNHFHLIFSMGSEAADYLSADYAHGAIPVVTSINKDPVLLGQVASYAGNPGGKIAYTSLNVPLALQMQYLKILKPNLRVMGLMYDQNHKQVVGTEVKPLKEELARQSIAVVDIAVSSQEEAAVQLATRMPLAVAEMQALDPKLEDSLFWVTSSTAIFAHIAEINRHSGTIPVVAGIPNAVTSGAESAVVAFGIDRRSNAHLAALYAVQILQQQVDPGTLPVGVVTPPDISINFRVAKKIGLKIPFRYFENATFIYDNKGQLVRDFGQNVVH